MDKLWCISSTSAPAERTLTATTALRFSCDGNIKHAWEPQGFVTFGILIAAAADSYKLQYESYQQLSCMWQMYYFVNIYFQQCEEGCHAIIPVCLCVCWRDNSKSGRMDLDELFWWVKRLLTVAAGYFENLSTVFRWNFWADSSWNKKDTTRVTFRIDPDPDRKPIYTIRTDLNLIVVMPVSIVTVTGIQLRSLLSFQPLDPLHDFILCALRGVPGGAYGPSICETLKPLFRAEKIFQGSVFRRRVCRVYRGR